MDGRWDISLIGTNERNKKIVDTLGNLTLISKIGNIIKSNKTPFVSQICYRALAAKNMAELSDFIKTDTTFTKNAVDYISEMERSDPHYFLEEFNTIALERWDVQHVNMRTLQLINNV